MFLKKSYPLQTFGDFYRHKQIQTLQENGLSVFNQASNLRKVYRWTSEQFNRYRNTALKALAVSKEYYILKR